MATTIRCGMLLLFAALLGGALAGEASKDKNTPVKAPGPMVGPMVGWRGNWTGKFPDANPPLTWGKVSKPMKGLRCQPDRPKDDQPAGVPAFCGALTKWMVLGPLPASDAKTATNEEFFKDEAACMPKEGDAVNGQRWRKVDVPGSLLNFESIFAADIPKNTPTRNNAGKPPYTVPFIAFAHTWLYSPAEATFRFRFRATSAAKLFLNGKEIQDASFEKRSDNNAYVGEFSFKLNKGWNHVLLKVRNDVGGYVNNSSWYMDFGFHASKPYDTVSEGIAWAALLPSYHIANPLIVGDRIFALSRPSDLVCIRKTDGKIAWIRSLTYYDILSDKDKQGSPAYSKLTPLVSELNKLDAAYVEKGMLSAEAIQKRTSLHQQIVQAAGEGDSAKFIGQTGHYPEANMPTPVSDGKNVYVWSDLGIAACYDLDGNRKWAVMPGVKVSVGRYVSPIIADGKLIIFENLQDHHKGGLLALDLRNGEILWSLTDKTVGDPFTALIPTKVCGEECIMYGKKLVHAKEGKVLVENGDDLCGLVPTPVIENGTLYGMTCRSGNVFKAKLPVDSVKLVMTNEGKITGLCKGQGETLIASPLYHEGLLYICDQYGYLYVIDAETQKLVYERDLGVGKSWEFDFYHAPDWGWGAIYASPMLAGKHIYVFGMSGTAVVFEPGREYKEVGRNKLEDCLLSTMYFAKGHEIPEFFASSPIAEGKRIYVRGGNYLYCLGDK